MVCSVVLTRDGCENHRAHAAALDAARGRPGLKDTVEDFRLSTEVLEWHAQGEELDR